MEPSDPPHRHRRWTRRQFLARSAAVAGTTAAATFGYTWRIEPHWIDVVHRPLMIAHLPARWIGRTLVQISDLHIGPIVDEAYMTAALRRVSSLAADLLVVTGDFMTCHGAEQVSAVRRVLANLSPGRVGTVGILGNHDYGQSWQSTAAADALTDVAEAQGIIMLRNQITDVDGLQLAGVDDLWGPNHDAAATLAQLDQTGPHLALCHNPDAVDLPAWSNYQGWILAGHTHGGQCKPPFLPPPLLPVRNRRYTSGEFALAPGRSMYINRGLGYLHRVRFNARPEITVFTLTA